MSWTIVLPTVVTLLYFGTSLAYAWKGDWAWFIVWFAYAVANIGLIIAGNR